MLRIDKVLIDGDTGHITVHARYAEVNGKVTTLGVKHPHGISPQALQLKYNGDQNAWLNAIHTELKAQHAALVPVNDVISKLVGKVIDFDEQGKVKTV